MKSVFASACCCIVERHVQVVLAKKPAEDAMGFVEPVSVVRQPICLKTGGDCRAGLDRLLIEACLFFALFVGSVGADGNKNLCVTAVLGSYKPFERLDSRRDHSLVIAAPSRKHQRLRQPRIRVRKTLLEPMPVIGVTAFVNVQQPIGKCVTDALDRSVAWEPVQIGLHAENTECPCARTTERQYRGHGCLKESSCRSPQSSVLRMAKHSAQSP